LTAVPSKPVDQRRQQRDGDTTGAVLRRVETDLSPSTAADRRATERPRVDRPASEGDSDDDGGGGGGPGQLKRWPDVGREYPAGRQEEDQGQPWDVDDRQHAPVPSPHSSLTATPDDSQTDSSLVLRGPPQTDSDGRPIVVRATVI